MRAVILVLIIAVAAVLIGLATGFLHVGTRHARPQATATTKSVQSFDVETGSVKVGTRRAEVKVPVLEVAPANEAANQAETPRQAK